MENRERIRAASIKGQPKVMGSYQSTRKRAGPYSAESGNVLMSTGGKKEGATKYIPFKRTAPGHRPSKGLKKLTTVSIPQMIGNKTVAEQIQKNIDEGLTKRLENHVKQTLAKRDKKP